ncbi:hydrolase [Bradyrhizobium sp. LTSPM299]|uniref:alpha/beta hydrolase n=1 Tax=Bradyrhizobium sp. LTSPM299 TaxID=1619233 RepID=UPI0005CA89C0|nr:alpha/beta hydrolase [Bradyrhizobium sp. LTSPM299]KJC54486.1 hydrolase [Bradyrhizobium sp. LTSPM299]
MSEKPTIVLVHGFWGGAAHWAKVIPILVRKGYDVHAVENPLTSLSDDAERTRKMIAAQKGPVLLVGHSYGGAVITEAGNHENVVGLVYIAAFAPDAGESAGSVASRQPSVAGANLFADDDQYLWIKQDKFHESFCQDLTPEEGLVMGVTQKAPLLGTFANNVTVPAWKSKPSWYQISSEDRMLPADIQKWMSARMNPKKIITLNSSHASLASKPNEVAALIDEAAIATSKARLVA